LVIALVSAILVKLAHVDINGRGCLKVDLRMEDAKLVDCHDLDRFVATVLKPYGVEWRSLDTGYDGYHNGSMESATVEYGLDVEIDLDQDFGRWLDGGVYYDDDYMYNQLPGIQEMLQWLCNMKLIEPGTYVVHLWW
jgi:hypothetical protein